MIINILVDSSDKEWTEPEHFLKFLAVGWIFMGWYSFQVEP
jgi:hypothetical protein